MNSRVPVHPSVGFVRFNMTNTGRGPRSTAMWTARHREPINQGDETCGIEVGEQPSNDFARPFWAPWRCRPTPFGESQPSRLRVRLDRQRIPRAAEKSILKTKAVQESDGRERSNVR